MLSWADSHIHIRHITCSSICRPGIRQNKFKLVGKDVGLRKNIIYKSLITIPCLVKPLLRQIKAWDEYLWKRMSAVTQEMQITVKILNVQLWRK